jgi:hypothetical protein
MTRMFMELLRAATSIWVIGYSSSPGGPWSSTGATTWGALDRLLILTKEFKDLLL